MARLPEKGLVGLGFWENGFRQVTNSRRPINTAADFAGLKLRVIQNPLFIETFTSLGASAQPMPFPEVYTALEQGVVDGQENPLATILASKFYEVQEQHGDLQPHLQRLGVPDEQEVLGQALARRAAADHRGRPRRRRPSNARSSAPTAATRWRSSRPKGWR